MIILNTLVSISSFFLLLFSIHLFFSKKGNKKQNVLLAIVFFTRTTQLATSVVMTAENTQALRILFPLFTPFHFILPACFYLYTTGFIHQRKHLLKREWLHFIPALIALVHVFPWPGTPPLDWNLIASQLAENGYLTLRTKSGLFPTSLHYIGRPLLIIFYLLLTWFTILKSGILKETKTNSQVRDWVLFFISAATFFQLTSLAPIVVNWLHLPLHNTFFIILNCIALLLIFLYSIHNPHIFYGNLLISINWDKKSPEQKIVPIEDSILTKETKQVKVPVKKINLSTELLSSHAQLMIQTMENDKIYLNPDLQIIDVASKLNIPIHHCSYVINNHIGKNFRDWLNAYRVEHFLKEYPLHLDKKTIEAIAQESGFKSQATFYNAFKKEKGVMPTVYFSPEKPL
ncbi:helix-turn-helix domain-containing protein [Pedobacter sp. MW01-1-1]|uniref:helix-turn-helix domain-containing protein n=1 Tax=Pedobacter sp. MW01-1-1 TaxID=3383027 RepID=UPI003FEF5FC2